MKRGLKIIVPHSDDHTLERITQVLISRRMCVIFVRGWNLGYFHLLTYPFRFLDFKVRVVFITKKSYFRKKIGVSGGIKENPWSLFLEKIEQKYQRPKGPTLPRTAWVVLGVCSKKKGMKKQKMAFCPY